MASILTQLQWKSRAFNILTNTSVRRCYIGSYMLRDIGGHVEITVRKTTPSGTSFGTYTSCDSCMFSGFDSETVTYGS